MFELIQNRFPSAILALAACALGAQEATCQELRARVVDERSRTGVVGAAVTLLATDTTEVAWATTGPDGFFQLSAPDYGPYVVQIQHLAGVYRVRAISRGSTTSSVPAF